MSKEIDIRKLRDARGWSQGQMANFLGVDRSTVSRIENGQLASGAVRKLLEQLAASQPKKRAAQ
jgi:transcriptional regulator with XRE-family HTH domain